MSQHANQASVYNDSSVLVAMGAYAGSLFATIMNSDMAAWTTLVATVGTLSYQFFKIWLENRKKNFLIEFHASMDAAKAETEAVQAEKSEIQRRCDQMERDKEHYAEWVEQLLHKEGHEDGHSVRQAD